jgi:hypothetical protein
MRLFAANAFAVGYNILLQHPTLYPEMLHKAGSPTARDTNYSRCENGNKVWREGEKKNNPRRQNIKNRRTAWAAHACGSSELNDEVTDG